MDKPHHDHALVGRTVHRTRHELVCTSGCIRRVNPFLVKITALCLLCRGKHCLACCSLKQKWRAPVDIGTPLIQGALHSERRGASRPLDDKALGWSTRVSPQNYCAAAQALLPCRATPACTAWTLTWLQIGGAVTSDRGSGRNRAQILRAPSKKEREGDHDTEQCLQLRHPLPSKLGRKDIERLCTRLTILLARFELRTYDFPEAVTLGDEQKGPVERPPTHGFLKGMRTRYLVILVGVARQV